MRCLTDSNNLEFKNAKLYIESAAKIAINSTCAKSYRGVVIVNEGEATKNLILRIMRFFASLRMTSCREKNSFFEKRPCVLVCPI